VPAWAGVVGELKCADDVSNTDEEDAVACFVELRFEALTHFQAPEVKTLWRASLS